MNDEMNDDKISSQQISRKNNVYYIHCIHIYGGGSMFGVENAIKNTYLLLPLRRPLLVGI
jgi:hypothetical protein